MSVMNVIGVQKTDFTTKEGQHYLFSKVFCVARLDANETRAGFAGIEMRGILAIADKYLEFPFKRDGTVFEVEIEAIATGKGEFKDTIVAMVPVAEMQAKSVAIPPRTVA